MNAEDTRVFCGCYFPTGDEFHQFLKDFFETYDPLRGPDEAYELYTRAVHQSQSDTKNAFDRPIGVMPAPAIQQLVLDEVFALYPEALTNVISTALWRYAPQRVGQDIESKVIAECVNFTGVATWLMKQFDLVFGYFLPRDTPLRVAVLCREEWIAHFGEPSGAYVRPGVSGENDLLMRLEHAGGTILDERTTLRRFSDGCHSDATPAQRQRAALWRVVWRSAALRAVVVDSMMAAANGDARAAIERYMAEQQSRSQRCQLELHFARLGLSHAAASTSARNAMLSRASPETDLAASLHFRTSSPTSVGVPTMDNVSGSVPLGGTVPFAAQVSPSPGNSASSARMLVQTLQHSTPVPHHRSGGKSMPPPPPQGVSDVPLYASPAGVSGGLQGALSSILSPSTPFASSLHGIVGGGATASATRGGVRTIEHASFVDAPDGLELDNPAPPALARPTPPAPGGVTLQRQLTFSALDSSPTADPSFGDLLPDLTLTARPQPVLAVASPTQSPAAASTEVKEGAPPRSDANAASIGTAQAAPSAPKRAVVSFLSDGDADRQDQASLVAHNATTSAQIDMRLKHVEQRERQLRTAAMAAKKQLDEDASEMAELRAVLERSAAAVSQREEGVNQREAAVVAREAALEKHVRNMKFREDALESGEQRLPEDADRLRRVHLELQLRERDLEELQTECEAAIAAVADREARLAQSEAAGEARVARQMATLNEEARELRESTQKRVESLNHERLALQHERDEWMAEQSKLTAARDEHFRKLKDGEDVLRRRERAVTAREEDMQRLQADLVAREERLLQEQDAIKAAKSDLAAKAATVRATAESLERQSVALDQQAQRLKQREEALWRVSALAGAAVQRTNAGGPALSVAESTANMSDLTVVERSLSTARGRLQRLGTTLTSASLQQHRSSS